MKTEKEIWKNTTKLATKLFKNKKVSLGRHWSYNYLNDPKRFLFVLSRYKCCAKMIPKDAHILELGCSEGIGVMIVAENATSYTGVDFDEEAIKTAKKNLPYTFLCEDFMGKNYGKFDAIVSLDVIEHIPKKLEKMFFETIFQNLNEDGICLLGTPNITAKRYASQASKYGHVNLFSQKRLKRRMQKYFHQVFSFGMNDEIVHTGFANMAHYLLFIGCDKKDG